MTEPVEVALIVSLIPTAGVLITGWLAKGKLEEIHVLVNSRLAEVTDKLSALEAIRDAEGEAAKRIVLEQAARGLETTKETTDVQ